MPRPKKAGAPQPKKRSRNGCWPCKSRKVKCDEAHPACLNCQRQGETCDYSIRLNWDGRGKKKSEGSGQIVFSSNMIGSVLGATSGGENTDSQEETISTKFSQTSNLPTVLDAHTRPDVEPYEPPPQQAPMLAQYQLQPSPFASAIDPALMESQNQPGAYLPTPYQTYTPPDLTYAQSYERYDSRTSSPGSFVQNFTSARTRTAPRHYRRDNLHFDVLQHKTSLFRSSEEETTAEDEGLSHETNFIDRPSKRVKHNYPDRRDSSTIGPTDMPPPHMGSYGYSYGSYVVNQSSIPPIAPMNAPMTPASSTHSDESYKFYPTKLSPYVSQNSPDVRRLSQDSDPRRLSVESLLSGPPGILDEPNRKHSDTITSEPRTPHPSSAGIGEYAEETTTWGVDRGFRDLDIGKNDDSNAISGGSPITKREHMDFESEDIPVEFGFGLQAKDMNFEKTDYYAQPVAIKIPRSFEPLPPSLLENPMNLLYFHHFVSHTARLLVPHHCSSNPFQKILPKMAIQDENLMNLLLAYSASHRARLLQQPEPTTRIALWVKDVFPKLRHALNDPNSNVSNANLATAIMLASLEIISPKTFGVSVPWQQHLLMARSMVLARGGVRSMYYERSDVSRFLLRWFAYLDVLGSLIDGPADPPAPTGSTQSQPDERIKSGWLYEYDFDDEMDYQIDCLFGFTGRCITILALIAELARECDMNRIDDDKNIRLEWVPSEEVINRAEKLISDLEAARTNARVQSCPYLHSAGEAAYRWDMQEMAATNEAYHWAGLVHLHRRILGKPTTHVDVKNAVSEIIVALSKVRKGSSAEFCLLFPMFTAGCDTQDEQQKQYIMDRFRGIEDFGLSQVSSSYGTLFKNTLNIVTGTKSTNFDAKGVGHWKAMGDISIRRIRGLKPPCQKGVDFVIGRTIGLAEDNYEFLVQPPFRKWTSHDVEIKLSVCWASRKKAQIKLFRQARSSGDKERRWGRQVVGRHLLDS